MATCGGRKDSSRGFWVTGTEARLKQQLQQLISQRPIIAPKAPKTGGGGGWVGGEVGGWGGEGSMVALIPVVS